MARKLPRKGCRHRRARLDRLDPGQRADRRRSRRRSRSSAGHGATRRPTSRRTTRRTSCATASATSCSCGPTRRPSRSATRWTRRRCRSAPGARSCRRMASAAAASTGTPRPGASCPRDFVLRTHLTQRYGAGFLPADMTIQDWGVTYDELEPHYDRFEYLCGTSGTAGNLRGQIQEGGNPFEGPRSRPYPTSGRRRSRSATRCSPRPRGNSATSRSRSPPATCRRPI